MGIYNLQDGYSLASWYDNNGAYDLNAGTDMLLDLPRQILDSEAYMYQGVAFPKGADISFQPSQTFSGSINLTPYSYLVSLAGYSGNINQFTLRIFDKNAQTDLYYGQFAWFPTVVGNMSGTNMGASIPMGTPNKPFGPFLFRDPVIILPPGVLQVQLTNVSGSPAVLQMLFGTAVPKTTVSMNTRKVNQSSDQSGLPTILSAMEGLVA
jgi:hypothetical protein